MIGAFVAGYRLTDVWFRVKLIPYPFELYGIAVGLALVFWGFALLQIVEFVLSKIFDKKKMNLKIKAKVASVACGDLAMTEEVIK